MSHRLHRLAPLFLLCASFLTATPSLAAWSHDPTAPNRITSIIKNNNTIDAAVADGSGGAFVFWEDDNGGEKNVLGQHILFNGTLDPAWPGLGLVICNAPNNQTAIRAVSDGSGGCFLCWLDARGAQPQNYATRVLPNGTIAPGFAANGVLLDVLRPNAQHAAQVCDDGAGGMIAVWEYDFSAPDHDIVGARIQGNGAIVWDNNLIFSGLLDANPSVAREALTLDVVFSQGSTNFIVGRWSISLGVQVGGLPAATTVGSLTSLPRIAPDGWGGSFVTWMDFSGGTYQINADRYFGGVLTPMGPVSTPSPLPLFLGELIYAGNHQALLAWGSGGGDVRTGLTRFGISSPVQVGSLTSGPLLLQAGDGAGGSVTLFQRQLGFGSETVLAANRGPQVGLWVNAFIDGLSAMTLTRNAVPGAIVSDGDGGALIFGYDQLNTPVNSGFVMKLDRYGAYDGAPSGLSVRDIPGDQGGQARVSWNASYLDTPGGGGLTYALWRQAPAAAVAALGKRGPLAFLAEPLESLEPGTIRIQESATGSFAWELVKTQIADGFPSYSMVVPTVTDSSASGPANTVYMIEARSASLAANWPSFPDSGHTIDNLPPATPSPFAGAIVGGVDTRLHWGPNHEPDLAGYELYRGTSAGFVPGPSNLVGSPTDTTFLDHATSQFYKLAAIDSHGNRSGFALLTPGGTLDVGGSEAPSELALALVSANPAAQGVTLRYALPHAGPARLEVFDVNGRLVRALAAGTQPAGAYTVRWDGRDVGGADAPSGIYFIRLAAEGRELVQRVARSR